jgi:anti-sigma B factor antagonist
MILDVTTREENGRTIVALKGRLTLGNLLVSTENKLRSLIESGPVKVVLDLTELDYMDSAGIGMLMMCAGGSRANGGDFRIAGPNDRVKKIFEIANVDKIVPVHPTLDAALSA